MIRKYVAVLCIAAIFLFCGCNSGRSDFREIERLELIQTLGIDASNEAITVSAATGARQSKPPTILTNSAYTMGLALRRMQTFTDKNIYFAHVNNCLIGQNTAQRGLSSYLDYIERELSVRYTTGLFIVKQGNAEDVITKVGDENGYVTELLDALKKDVKMLSMGYVYSVGEVAQNMLEKGCALIMAIELMENEGIISGGSTVNVKPAGYALINGDRLECFIDEEGARGVNILTNKMGLDTIEVDDGMGGICALSVISSNTEYEAVFNEKGIPERIIIKIKQSANIDELHNQIDVYDEKNIDVLEKNLRKLEEERVKEVLSLMRLHRLDFIDLGQALRMKYPITFSKIEDKWNELLEDMDFELRWDIEIARTYDIGQPIGYSEQGGTEN